MTEKDSAIDAELVFRRYIGDAGGELDALADLLQRHAPGWCKKLRLYREPSDQRPIDCGSSRSSNASDVVSRCSSMQLC